MSDIDWSKAPEGATHFDTRGNFCSIGFMKPGVRRGEWEYFGMDGHWILYGLLDREIHDAMVEVPKSPEWTGEGLPPVGMICELRSVSAGTCWAKAHIKFASRNVVVWDWDGEPAINGLCTAYLHTLELRPLRTPEQIAAEEREKAVSQMAVIALAGDNELITKVWLERLYDAGYHKVVEPNNAQ